MLLVLKMDVLKGGLIGGAPYFPWPGGWLNRFFAFFSNQPRTWHIDFDGFKDKNTKENEDDEDWKWFGETIWIKNGLRVRNLEREKNSSKPRLKLGSRDLDVENGFQGSFWVLNEMGNFFLDSIWCEKDRKWRILEWERERNKTAFRESGNRIAESKRKEMNNTKHTNPACRIS